MANKRNYQKELDAKIAGLHGEVPTFAAAQLLCAVQQLRAGISVAVFFHYALYYNPNIYPPTEYEHRVEEQQRLIHSLPAVHPISFCPRPVRF